MASKKEQVIQSIEVTYDTTKSVYDAIENICNLELMGAIGVASFMEVAEDAATVVPEDHRHGTLILLTELLEKIRNDLLALCPSYQNT